MPDQKQRKSWKQDAEGVKRDILNVALGEFAERGLAGARIDEIADKTRTSKRMIYYYFGDKEGLYLMALEAAYASVSESEEGLDLDNLDPEDAMRALVGFTFDHHRGHPELMRIVMGENMNHAAYLKRSQFIQELNLKFVARFEEQLKRGQDAGVFRTDVNPLLIHWQTQAQAFYNVSNRDSFAVAFGDDLFTAQGQEEMRAGLIDMVMRTLKP